MVCVCVFLSLDFTCSCCYHADTYGSSVSVSELAKSASGLKDKGRAHDVMLLYGYGDGGGGPTMDMLTRAELMADVDGLPRVCMH